MMIPKGVLRSMQIGATTLVIGILSGCESPAQKTANPAPAKRKVAVLPAAAPKLTEEQLKVLETALPKLVSENGVESQAAWQSIFALGPGAMEALQVAASKSKGDVNLQQRIQYLIRWINAGGDPCPPCGMG
jgi:hypothetical protein